MESNSSFTSFCFAACASNCNTCTVKNDCSSSGCKPGYDYDSAAKTCKGKHISMICILSFLYLDIIASHTRVIHMNSFFKNKAW